MSPPWQRHQEPYYADIKQPLNRSDVDRLAVFWASTIVMRLILDVYRDGQMWLAGGFELDHDEVRAGIGIFW